MPEGPFSQIGAHFYMKLQGSPYTLCTLIDSSFWFDTNNLEWSIVYIKGCQVIIFITYCVVFYLKIFFMYTYSVDSDEMQHYADEMQHYAAFHLGLHCLQKCSFRGFPNTKGFKAL